MNPKNSYFSPAERIQVGILVLCAIWLTPVAVISFLLFFILTLTNVAWQKVLFAAVFVAGGVIIIHVLYFQNSIQVHHFFQDGFKKNILFWKLLFKTNLKLACYYLYCHCLSYLIGAPLLASALMYTVRSLFNSPHRQALYSLSKGILPHVKELSDKKINKKLSKLKDENFDGTLLGLSKKTGKAVSVEDKDVNQMVLVLGTTGSGKTITLQRFYKRAIRKGYPLIIVTGKPTQEEVAFIMAYAKYHDRKFYGFNCGNLYHYDPLASGGYTELKDKIMSLKDQWDHDYYRSVAEDYLQTTFEVLLKNGREFELKNVSECLEYEKLALVLRKIGDESLIKKVKSLQHYERKALTGLQAHLNLLIHSELGLYFEKKEGYTFNLHQIIEENSIVYFALPALRFPHFSKVLGKLVINDIKACIETESSKCIFTIFDEFSVFAGEQVLNLVNMGRGKGIHAIFGTQGLADLQKIDITFENQLLNCCNTIICHRLNDQEGAEKIATWIGTKDAFDITGQISVQASSEMMGSISKNKSFIVHPDEIKQSLKMGEAFYVTKIRKFSVDKIKVLFTI